MPRIRLLWPRLRREVREHSSGYGVLVAFTFGGMLLAPMIFPEASLLQGALGGVFLGVWAALSAVPGHFF